jgi:hypothetical protein
MIDNDRLALPFKKGIEIVSMYKDMFNNDEKKYKGKVFFDIKKKSKDGKKILILIEAID